MANRGSEVGWSGAERTFALASAMIDRAIVNDAGDRRRRKEGKRMSREKYEFQCIGTPIPYALTELGLQATARAAGHEPAATRKNTDTASKPEVAQNDNGRPSARAKRNRSPLRPTTCAECARLEVAMLKQAQAFGDFVRPYLRRYPELTLSEVKKLHADCEPMHDELKANRAALSKHLAESGHVLA